MSKLNINKSHQLKLTSRILFTDLIFCFPLFTIDNKQDVSFPSKWALIGSLSMLYIGRAWHLWFFISRLSSLLKVIFQKKSTIAQVRYISVKFNGFIRVDSGRRPQGLSQQTTVFREGQKASL